ncbi:gamma-aminobutyric acid receptor subunit beta-1-like isoform X2 [Mizuhopecten yessoensis]|uniref:gamma-aminobutyric acid receptor subunit beta-1-like isoform X2 n=1 Tax=Mizuhopecten yessoensis TaxID=6573 RepID=UPI000B45C81C|nr:gamma-aminobutyric acid receptor subunit beta-1-like isoform X2 [Mizuhopecten yessoensis]
MSQMNGAEANEPSQKEGYLAQVFRQLVHTLERNNVVMEQVIEQLGQGDRKVQKSGSCISTASCSKAAVIKRGEKVTVELKVAFMKISDIDTVNQQFEADIFIQAKWEEPLLDETHVTEFDPMVMWTPKLLIMNLDGEFSFSRSTFNIHYDVHPYQHTLVLQLWRCRGFFKENLELEHFPVDVQDLTISVSTERSAEEVNLIEDQYALSSIDTKTFLDAAEWNVYKHVETYRDKTTIEYASSTVHPILHVQCRVARKLLIASLTFTNFAIEPEAADRLAVTITLFLTAVAFKFVVKQSLPTISYLTNLDIYVLSAQMFLTLHAAQNASIKALTRFSTADKVIVYDTYSMISLCVIFVMFHIIFGIYLHLTATKRRRHMKEKDRFYKEKKQLLEKYGVLKPNIEVVTRK